WMVEQLGLATMPLGIERRASAFTSGTTKGTCGSMRQALELSMTMAPTLAAMGLVSRLTEAGVLDRTIWTPVKASGRIGSTGDFFPLNSMVFPALRSEAKNLMLRRGKLCSPSTCRMISPTAPVAPTTATLTATGLVLSRKEDKNRHVFSLSRPSQVLAREPQAGDPSCPDHKLNLTVMIPFFGRHTGPLPSP